MSTPLPHGLCGERKATAGKKVTNYRNKSERKACGIHIFESKKKERGVALIIILRATRAAELTRNKPWYHDGAGLGRRRKDGRQEDITRTSSRQREKARRVTKTRSADSGGTLALVIVR